MRFLFLTFCLLTSSVLHSQLAVAEESPDPAALLIELNAAKTVESGCELSWVVTSQLRSPIASIVVETVVFDQDGTVDRFTLFDLGSLPAERPRVRQFVLPGDDCDAIGSILLNGVETCVIDGQNLAAECEAALSIQSRVEIELLG